MDKKLEETMALDAVLILFGLPHSTGSIVHTAQVYLYHRHCLWNAVKYNIMYDSYSNSFLSCCRGSSCVCVCCSCGVCLCVHVCVCVLCMCVCLCVVNVVCFSVRACVHVCVAVCVCVSVYIWGCTWCICVCVCKCTRECNHIV